MSLWQHQQDGAEFVNDKDGALLWWGMGSGKTYASINIIKKQNAEIILIVCPKSVIRTWISEIDKHAPNEFIVIAPLKGSVAKKAADIKKMIDYHHGNGKPIVIVLNYESCWRPFLGPVRDKYKNIIDNGLVKNMNWDIIIADEVHRCRTPGSKVSKFMSFLKAKKRIGLSGTPFSTPLSPFAIFRFLDKSIFAETLPNGKKSLSFQRYKMKYCVFGGFENRQVLKYINQDDLNEKIHSITHRIKTEDVIELPPFQHLTIEVELNPQAKKAYNIFKKEAILEFENGKELTAANVLVKHLRLAQIASGTVKDDDGVEHLVDNSKLKALRDLILGIDEPIVIFTRFRAEVRQIEEMIGKFQREGEIVRKTCKIVGGCDERDKFSSGEADIAIVNVASGGVGLNELALCNYSVYFSSGYDSLLYEQSLGRTRRSGSIVSQKVFYYHIVAKGTIDEVIMAAIEQKIDLVDAILEDFKQSIAR